MKGGMVRVVVQGLAMVALLAASACIDDPVVPLVGLSGIAPRQVELGDKLEVEGSAFPQGRKAHVTLEGALHRAGESPDVDADEVDLEGDVIAPDRIEITVTDTVLASLCGAGSTAAHTTFEGSLTVVFASQAPGGPPVSGRLEHVALDALPTAAGQVRYLANADEGEKLATALGVHLEARASGELVVTATDEGSRAQKLGLARDDVVMAADGVHTLTVADLAPPRGTASLSLVVRHQGSSSGETVTVPLDGVPKETPRRFVLPAAIVAATALLIALLAMSPGRGVVWLRRRMAARGPKASLDSFAHLTGLATAAMLPLLAPSADVGLLALVVFTGALAMALGVGSWRSALDAAMRTAPVALGLAGALVVAGSLRADELTAAQGALPWEWFALRSPAHLALALSCASWPLLHSGDCPASLRAFERCIATLAAALAVVVFFGGARLPLVPAHARGAMAWAGAFVLVGKTFVVSSLTLRVRDALPALSLGALGRATLLRLVPIAGVATLGASLWERHVTARSTTAAATFVLMGVVSAAVVLFAWPRSRARPRVDPLA
jgi:hypothetical protein